MVRDRFSPYPVVRYSPLRYWLVAATGAACGAALAAYGAAADEPVLLAAGTGLMVLALLFGVAAARKLRTRGPALAREGDRLIGEELPEPLPVAGTTFRTESDNEGSWIIVLRSGPRRLHLAAGGWTVDGHRFVTRSVAETILGDLGLSRDD